MCSVGCSVATKLPRNAPIVVWVWRGMILKDMDTVLPVHPVEVVPQSYFGVGLPWSPWKKALTFVSVLGEADLIYLR